MKPFRQTRFFIFLIAALCGAAALLVPFFRATSAAVADVAAHERARAEEEVLPQLDDLSDTCSQELQAGMDPDVDFEEELQTDLMSLQRLDESLLAYFTLTRDEYGSDSTMVSNEEVVRGERKRLARKLLDENDPDGKLEEAISGLADALQRGERRGVRPFAIGRQTYHLAWRGLDADVSQVTGGTLLVGFVVDYSRSSDAVRRSTRNLLHAVLGFVACLLAAAVAVLAHFLRQAQREALQKTTFVSNVSHELRTPLTSLMSYAEMLATGRCRTEEKKAKAMGVILDEGRRLNRMILELLDFSRLERGTRRYQLEAFDLAETVRETVERLGGRFAEHGIEVAAPDAVAVTSDRDTVRQILENLLTNAAKYAAKGGPVEVSVKVRDGRVKLAVADRGPGMTRSQMKHAFDAFWRADNSTTRETNGYGIGLAVARGYARGLRGDLSVAARPGGGCTFTFEFPIKQ